MEFTDKDFDRMLWKVHRCSSAADLPHSQWNEFKLASDVTKFKVLSYIAYCYDINSPFVIHYDNITKRKKEAATKAKFPTEDGKFVKKAELIIQNKNEIVNAMIIRYLRLLRNTEWSVYITFLDAIHTQEIALLGNAEGADTQKIIKNIKDLREQIQELRRGFLNNDENEFLIDTMYDAIENDELGLTPEDIAKAILEKNVKLFSAYSR